MAEFNGILADDGSPIITDREARQFIATHDEDDSLMTNREIPIFTAAVVDDDDETIVCSREKQVLNVIILRPFLWDDNEEAKVQGVRQVSEYGGLIPWGDGNLPPRRYPLELSWRSPIRQ